MFNLPAIAIARDYERMRDSSGTSRRGSANVSAKGSRKTSPRRRDGEASNKGTPRAAEVPARRSSSGGTNRNPPGHAEAAAPSRSGETHHQEGTPVRRSSSLAGGKMPDAVVFALPRAKTAQEAIAQLRRIQTRGASRTATTSVAEREQSVPHRGVSSSSALALDELGTARDASPPVNPPSNSLNEATSLPAAASEAHASQSGPLPKGELPATLQEFYSSPHYVVSLYAARQAVFDDALSGFHSYAEREREELVLYWQLQTRRKEAQRPISYERKMGFEGGNVSITATPVYRDPLKELEASMKDGESLPASALFVMRSHDAQVLHEREAGDARKPDDPAAADGTVEHEKEEAAVPGGEATAPPKDKPSQAQAELAQLCQSELCFRTRIQERLYERQRIPLMFRRRTPPAVAADVSSERQAGGVTSKKHKKKSLPDALSSSDLASLAVLDHPPTTPSDHDKTSSAFLSRGGTGSSAAASLRPEWPYVYEQFQRDLHREVLLVNGTQYTNPEDAVAAIESFLECCYDRGLAKVQKRAAAAATKKESLRAKRGFFENLIDTVSTFADDVARAAAGITAGPNTQASIYSADPARRGTQLYEATRQAVLAAQQSFMGFPYQLLCEQVGTGRIALALEALEQELDAWMTAAKASEGELTPSPQSSFLGSPTRHVSSLSCTLGPSFEQPSHLSVPTPRHARRLSGAQAPPAPLELPAALRAHHAASAAHAEGSPSPPPASATQLLTSPLSEPSPLKSPHPSAVASFTHPTSPLMRGQSTASSANRVVRLYGPTAASCGRAEGGLTGSGPGGDADGTSNSAEHNKAPPSRSASSSSSASSTRTEHRHDATALNAQPTHGGEGAREDGAAAEANVATTATVEPSSPASLKRAEREDRRRRREEKRQQSFQRRLQEKRAEQLARMPLIVGEPHVAEYEKLLEKIRDAVRAREAVDRTIKAKRDAAKKKSAEASAVPTKSHNSVEPDVATDTAQKDQFNTATAAAGHAPQKPEEAHVAPTADTGEARESWFREDVDGSALLLPTDSPSLLSSSPLSSSVEASSRVSDRAMRTYVYFNEKRNIPMVCVDKVFRLFTMPSTQAGGPPSADQTSAGADAEGAAPPSDKTLLLLIQVRFSLFDSEDAEIRWRWWAV